MSQDLNFLHLDMDAFFAAVEEIDNPKLKGHPLIVGGRSNSGIVTTCNYIAREYGIHSAMPIFMAKERCPHGIYVPGRMDRYRQVSKEVFKALRTISPTIEQISIDEAYMDISGFTITPEEISDKIKKLIYNRTGLTLSIGVSYNKFLAKIASDWNKPNGFMKITEDMMPELLFPFSVGKVYGIGAKSKEKLNQIGIYTVEDLYSLSKEFLIELFGKGGEEIYSRIRGIDKREIQTTRIRKSMGVERTFRATRDRKLLLEKLSLYSRELSEDLAIRNLHGRTLSVKIKDEDFKTHTKSRSYGHYIWEEDEIYTLGATLFSEMEWDKGLRLLGISISNLMDRDQSQLSFFK